jgi:RNA polymerase sigma factor (sigma-70 family)
VHPGSLEVPDPIDPIDGIDIDALYRRYSPMVLRRCRRLLGDDAGAEDVMHDVFVKVLSHRDRLDSAAPASLLWTVATRLCLNRLRTIRRSRESADHQRALLHALAELPDEAERTSAGALLARLFGQEPVSSRVIAVLHYVDGMTLEETATEVGLSLSGVRKRLRALRTRLAAILPEEGP